MKPVYKHVAVFTCLIMGIFTLSAGTFIQAKYLDRQSVRLEELHAVLNRLAENQNELHRDSRVILDRVRELGSTNSYQNIRTFVLYSQADQIAQGTVVLFR
jgi:hypothetical protein